MMKDVGEEDTLSEHLWQSVIDTVAEGLVIVNGEGHIRHINLFAAKTLGVSRDASVGKHFREIFCPSLPLKQCWVNLCLAKDQKLRNHRFRVERTDGRAYYAIANLTPIKPEGERPAGAVISIRAEDEVAWLAQEENARKAIFSSLAEGLIIVNNDWRITSFNQAAARISGWSEEQVLGRPCKQILTCAECEDLCLVAPTQSEPKPLMNVEMTIRHRRGGVIPLIVNSTALFDSEGNPIGTALVLQKRDSCLSADADSAAFFGIVGKNKRMLEVFDLIRKIANSKATVLILGESGTGKVLAANAIQKLSSREMAPFLELNCAAIPDSLIVSELFGHIKGAFLEAHNDRIGAFEAADGGTVLLDDVHDLGAPAQYRLMRFLEDGSFQRLGSPAPLHADVRVIATATCDLFRLVKTGKFRDDLFYRLNIIPIHLPPLRDRTDDLPLLIEHFMQKLQRLTGKPISEISDRAFDLLMAYSYPGNVRELENIIEHAFARTSGNIITANKLPPHVRYFSPMRIPPQRPQTEVNGNDEAAHVREVLMRCRWNRSAAAKILGMSRTTLWRRMRELHLLDEDR